MAYWDNLKITSGTGKRNTGIKGASTNHRGLDVVFPDGKVRPEVGGTVFYSGNMDGYGNIVILKGDDGNFYHYAHNAKNRVKKGQRVNPNEVIATMGNTGTSGGPHSHIEVTNAQGINLDPRTRQSLNMGGNKLASQGFYGNPTGAAAPVQGGGVPMINIAPQVGQIAEGTLTGNAALALQNKLDQERLARQYDIAGFGNAATENIEAIKNAYNAQIQNAMQEGQLSPEQVRDIANIKDMENALAQQQANQNLEYIKNQYEGLRTPEQLANYMNQAVNQLNANYVASNPTLQASYTGQGGYQIDPEELLALQGVDRNLNNFHNALYRTALRTGDPAATTFVNNPSQRAQQYLQNQQAIYEAQMANRYGVPYQQLMEASKQYGDLQKAYAPNYISGINAANQQEGQNFREIVSQLPKVGADVYKTGVEANQDLVSNIQKANENARLTNQQMANLLQEAAKSEFGIQQKQPELQTRKYETIAQGLRSPVNAMIQGNTGVGTQSISTIGANAGNINTNLTKQDETTNKRISQAEQNQINLMKAMQGGQDKTQAAQIKREAEIAKQRQQAYDKVVKFLSEPSSGLNAANTAMMYLINAGIDKNDAANIVRQIMEQKQEGKRR